ncbi:hypothetical protein B0H14DRAFT_2654557 [Mycena olivaceomarginata]|nr:hypothetical protein B0H14DRAFT_2654557 [Mycena olivaceomarginata]
MAQLLAYQRAATEPDTGRHRSGPPLPTAPSWCPTPPLEQGGGAGGGGERAGSPLRVVPPPLRARADLVVGLRPQACPASPISSLPPARLPARLAAREPPVFGKCGVFTHIAAKCGRGERWKTAGGTRAGAKIWHAGGIEGYPAGREGVVQSVGVRGSTTRSLQARPRFRKCGWEGGRAACVRRLACRRMEASQAGRGRGGGEECGRYIYRDAGESAATRN